MSDQSKTDGGLVGGAKVAANDVPNVNVGNPLSQPYGTGSYFIRDLKTGDPDHVRRAWSLEPHPYPASGSRQLNASQLLAVLSGVIGEYQTRDLFLVDLREETHGFIDGTAVSWYADNDFANVGESRAWIEADEAARLAALKGQTKQVFTIKTDASDNRGQQRMMPVTFEKVTVKTPTTERAEFDNRKVGNCTIHYVRIPVTDHCAPAAAALEALQKLPVSSQPMKAWVHFHCHGGDGRTTSFLTLYDMMCWKASSKEPLPSLEMFACRQFSLPPHYVLDPDGCNCPTATSLPIAGWKRPLAIERWKALEDFHSKVRGS